MYILKKGFKQDLGLPYDRRSNPLPIFSDSLPLFGLICHRSVNFCKSVSQVTHQLLILYHFMAYFLDALSNRWEETPYFVVNCITSHFFILFI